jgi:hypothetical protein
MPPTDAALNEKEVNDGQSCARAPQIAGHDTEGRSESLDEAAAFGMWLKFEQTDKLTGSRMHG